MKKRFSLFAIALLTGLSACNRVGSGESSLPLMPIVNNIDNPNSVFLRITDVLENDSSFVYTTKGLLNNDTLGFLVSVNKNIEPGILEDGTVSEKGFNQGSVKFLRSGEESDLFVQRLAELWGVEWSDSLSNVGFSKAAVIPLAFLSNKSAIDHNKASTSSFKLFFNPDAAEPGEIFFTLDLYRRGIEFQEKDATYRSQIVHSFSGN